ncbi:MAG: MBL fold metallo-hydrolase [Gemmatimonadaceae bacterium]|nr:MBL fold metallo-hydrolase [Gemmatimonadaceae bacterium]
MSQVRLTHIGGPTMLIEVGPWRLLTDPTFDPPGRRYAFALGTSSRKLIGPALSASDLPPIDAVLLSHDQHADNLDDAGRALLPQASVVVTTCSGAIRLRAFASVRGLDPWQRTRLEKPGAPPLDILATPCQHGPPVLHHVSGDVIGFGLTWEGQQHGALWVSGDTVPHRALNALPQHLDVGLAIVHLGGVGFPLTGPLRYTFTAHDAARFLANIRPHTIVPIHVDGWSHFLEAKAVVERTFVHAVPPLTWLTPGVATPLTM